MAESELRRKLRRLITIRLVISTMLLGSGTLAQITAPGSFAVALLSGSLAEGMRSAGVKLEQASSTIADLQALNQHVIDSLPSGLATTDTAQRILTFNRAAEAITGLSFDSVAGRPIAEVLQFPRQLLADLESDPRGAAARRADYRFKTDHGEIEIGLGATH